MAMFWVQVFGDLGMTKNNKGSIKIARIGFSASCNSTIYIYRYIFKKSKIARRREVKNEKR